MTTEFCMTVYSLDPLPKDVRGTFKLPMWPFKNGAAGPIPGPTLAYFRTLRVIHYRDELNSFAMLVDQAEGEPTHARQHFIAYKSSGVLLFKGMSIKEWNPRGDPVKFRKIVQKYGDGYAWMEWNMSPGLGLFFWNILNLSALSL